MYSSLEDITNILSHKGFKIDDPWDVVDAFEKMIAQYAGSKYAVAVDNCTNGLFLCLKYLNATGKVTIPARTYVSVPQVLIHAGCEIQFEEAEWSGVYFLKPYPIVDGATRFKKGMYIQDTYQCLSFHIKKTLPIGKGGMILTNDHEAYKWFKKARYEGRDITVPYDEDQIDMLGWNMYMPPEQAAYGIKLFLQTNDNNDDCGGSWKYPDCRQYNFLKEKKCQ